MNGLDCLLGTVIWFVMIGLCLFLIKLEDK
jgi:hypothetical protein